MANRKAKTSTKSVEQPVVEPSNGVSEESWKLFATNCEVVGGRKLKEGTMVRVENVYHSRRGGYDVAFCRMKAGAKTAHHINVEYLEIKTPFTAAERKTLIEERTARAEDKVLVEANVIKHSESGKAVQIRWEGAGRSCWCPVSQWSIEKDLEDDAVIAAIPAWVILKNFSQAELDKLREGEGELETAIS